MEIKVLFFASLAEKLGVSNFTPSLPNKATMADLKAAVVEKFPAAAETLPLCLVAVNQAYATGNPSLHPTDEVAIFPPVTGG